MNMTTTRCTMHNRLCGRCNESFSTTYPTARYCPDCYRHGGNSSFRIEGMYPAEFAFKTIMERQGITLLYNAAKGGVRFLMPQGWRYRPDFRIPNTDIYYEVCGSKGTFELHKAWYAAFKKHYSHCTLLCVKPDGTELIIDEKDTVPTRNNKGGPKNTKEASTVCD